MVGLGILDRLGGAVLGVLKWSIILGIMITLTVGYGSGKLIKPEAVEKSIFYKPLHAISVMVMPHILRAKEKYIDPADIPGMLRRPNDTPEPSNDTLREETTFGGRERHT
jgi:membrane protein required for colicin V production